MAIVTTDDKHYKAIADKLREIVDAEATYRPEDMADEIGVANNAGYEDGYADGEETGFWDGWNKGFDEGFSEGADAEHDHVACFLAFETQECEGRSHAFRVVEQSSCAEVDDE